MSEGIAKKFRIHAGNRLWVKNAPMGFEKKMGSLPQGARWTKTSSKDFQQIHWFVKNKADLEKDLSRILEMMNPSRVCWIYFPKSSSGIQTDLTRDNGWEKLMKDKDIQMLNLVSFDETWSAFGFRRRASEKAKSTDSKVARPIAAYIDPVTRTIRLPEDLAAALEKNRKEKAFFDTLSFTNRKEYVEWIVSAKKEDTRKDRLNETIQRLGKQWKNPRNL
jgi:hypothetical protein